MSAVGVKVIRLIGEERVGEGRKARPQNETGREREGRRKQEEGFRMKKEDGTGRDEERQESRSGMKM
jgi:hypothetical protein